MKTRLTAFLATILTTLLSTLQAQGQSTGALVQWGSTGIGQANNAPPLAGPYIAIAAGAYHNLALRADGSLVQWGDTAFGQAKNAPPPAGPYIAIAAGGYHNLALRADGSLVQWGNTSVDQGNNAPLLAGPYTAIAAGGYHNLALRADGSLVQWGRTLEGQTVNAPPLAGPYIAIAAGAYHNLALRADGSLVQWGDPTRGQASNSPPPAGPYIAIAAGYYHNLALRADGSLVQWGDTSSGQANNSPPLTGPYIAIAAGTYHNLALRADGSLVQWGDPTRGQASNSPPAAGPYTAIAAGFSHSLALTGLPATSVRFTYQGTLQGNTGPVDLRLTLYASASGGSPRGNATLVNAVTLGPGGVFTLTANPGPINASIPLWAEIAVAPAGSGNFTTLTPRQPISPVPSASYASVAGIANRAIAANTASSVPWSGITGVPSSVANAFSPWAASPNNAIAYTGGNVGIGTASPQTGLHIATTTRIDTNADLRFGAAGENGDTIFLRRFNFATNQSGLQLEMGTAGNAANNNDAFIITEGGTTLFQFNSQLGGQALKPGGGSWGVLSDARAKHDIQPLDGSLDRLLRLQGRTYEYNDPEAPGAGRGRRTGFVAQQVEPVFPEWIGSTANGLKTLNITGFEALTVEALRDLRREKDEQIKQRDKKIESQGRDIEDLKARLQRIEEMLKSR
ncbi:MAG: tail fiber domain-containing protein [Phycisphaerales bacterium]|nr:tail fiber domain-containing protein [Phycisphaerales bacterium]